MKFDDTMLQRLEKLSMLRIEKGKREAMIAELEKIVGFVEVLNELDTDRLDSSFSTVSDGTPMREDTPREDPAVKEAILSRAPESRDDYFVVPSIIE